MSTDLSQNIDLSSSKPIEKKKSFLERDIVLFNKFTDKKKEAFYNDLEILIKAGVDLKKAFEIILEEQTGQKDEDFYKGIYEDILSGK